MAKAKKTKEQQVQEKIDEVNSKKDLNKLELLNLAVAKIEKDFGKGTISNTDNLRSSDQDYISSGSLLLNDALTGTFHRGFAKGTIVEIYGWESSGKCLDKNAYIFTATGYKQLKDIFKDCGLEILTIIKDIKMEYPLINKNGDIETTTHFTYNGKKTIYEVISDSGFKQRRTSNHPLMCLSENGILIWKNTSNIKIGDILVNRITENIFGNKVIDKDTSYLLGLLIADGSLQDNRINITSDDDGIKEFIENKISSILKIDYNIYKKSNQNNSYDYHFNSKENITNFYNDYELTSCLSKNKYLPNLIMEMNKESISNFLMGYLDSECYFFDKGFEVSSASYKLLYQIKLILTQFGITSNLSHKVVNTYPENDYWILTCYGINYSKFIDIFLEFSKSTKQIDKMILAKKSLKNISFKNNIPNITNLIIDLYKSNDNRTREISSVLSDLTTKNIDCSKIKLNEILNNIENPINDFLFNYLNELNKYTFEKVVSIKQLEEKEPTFDFAMSKTHTFIADGCINHNTSLALAAGADVQKNGGIVAIIDAEHALDPVYAKKLGFDISKAVICQPDNGEEGLNVCKELCKSNAVDLIIIDSVATLVPKAEIEGEIGDQFMGLQARMMSQALRELTPVIAKSKTVVIFINQFRCLPENTLVNINGQLKRLVDVNKGDLILKSNDEFVLVNDKFLSGVVEGYLLTCKYRGDVRLSNNHKQPVISDGRYVIKSGKNIKVGDWLLNPVLKFDNLSNDIPYVEFSFTAELSNRVKEGSLYTIGDEKLALLCGMFFSDGYLNDDPNNSFINFTENDTERHTLVKELCKEILPDYTSFSNNTVTIRGLKPITYLKSIGLINKGSHKKIPAWIISSKRDVIKSFIRGCFFDTHGFNSQGFIFTCESDETETFHKLLIHLGVFSDLRSDNRKYDRLYFTGSDAITFTQEVGFLEKKKQIASTLFSPTENCRGKYDVVPHALGYVIFESIRKKVDSYSSAYKKASACSWSKLNFSRENLLLLFSLIQERTVGENEWYNLLKANRFTEIQNITSVSFKAVDIEVDKELFIADNFLTHNSKIGVLFGSPETTSGGNALKFYASQRLEIRKGEAFGLNYATVPKDEDIFAGMYIRVKLAKNKIAPPFRKCEIPLLFETGIDRYCEILDIATKFDLIGKSGSWYSFNDEKIGQGKTQVINFLKENNNIVEEILNTLKKSKNKLLEKIDIPEEEINEEEHLESNDY